MVRDLALGIVTLLVLELLIVPICMIYSYKFWQQRNAKPFLKRKIEFTMYLLSLFILGIGVVCPLQWIILSKWADDKGTAIFGEFAFAIVYGGIMTFLPMRAWLIHFDIAYSIAARSQKWSQHITSEFTNSRSTMTGTSSFYIGGRATWGKESWLFWRVVPIWLTFVILQTALFGAMPSGSQASAMVTLVQAAIGSVAFAIIWIRTPTFNDVWRLRTEISSVGAAGAVLFMGYVMLAILSRFTRFTVLPILFVIFVALMSTVMVLLMTLWPLSTFAAAEEIYSDIAKRPELRETSSMAIDTMTTQLKLTHTVHGFMTHLMSEFCEEHLLFLIEVSQFKTAIAADIGKSRANLDRDDAVIQIEFAPDIPRSYIVSSNEVWPEKAKKLYNKYCKTGSEYEINLSSKVRSELLSLFVTNRTFISGSKLFSVFGDATAGSGAKVESLNTSDMYTTFDGAVKEICLFLRDSFNRYNVMSPRSNHVVEFDFT